MFHMYLRISYYDEVLSKNLPAFILLPYLDLPPVLTSVTINETDMGNISSKAGRKKFRI